MNCMECAQNLYAWNILKAKEFLTFTGKHLRLKAKFQSKCTFQEETSLVVPISLNQTQLTPDSQKTTWANILLFVLSDVWRTRKPFVMAVKASLINEDRYRCIGFNNFLWFQNLSKHECVYANSLQLCLTATPWTVAHQAPLSMGFCRQEHWSGLPCPLPGDPPNPGMEPGCLLHWQVSSLPPVPPGKPCNCLAEY